jgi:hypothetical protein
MRPVYAFGVGLPPLLRENEAYEFELPDFLNFVAAYEHRSGVHVRASPDKAFGLELPGMLFEKTRIEFALPSDVVRPSKPVVAPEVPVPRKVVVPPAVRKVGLAATQTPAAIQASFPENPDLTALWGSFKFKLPPQTQTTPGAGPGSIPLPIRFIPYVPISLRRAPGAVAPPAGADAQPLPAAVSARLDPSSLPAAPLSVPVRAHPAPVRRPPLPTTTSSHPPPGSSECRTRLRPLKSLYNQYFQLLASFLVN